MSSANGSSRPARVLMFSQRNICEIEVWRSALREFEEIIREVDAVDLLAPTPGKWFKHLKRLALRAGRDSRLVLNPGIPRVTLDRRYDLFFAICDKPSELLNIDVVRGWKDACATSVCWLTELWVKEMPLFKSSLKVLSKFDHVLSHLSQSVAPINEIIGGQCVYTPPGVDTVRFLPYPQRAGRPVDVLSIGRRSEPVHQALLRLARDGKIFYVYDTLKDLHAYSLEEHRLLVTSMAKRSRYFVVNPAKCNSPGERGDQSEMGSRYFEGAAAGTIMIGERPHNEHFDQAFFWPDAVVHLPGDARTIEDILVEMDRQPDRQDKIRRTNVMQALLRHDWVYRWETVLALAGLPPMPELARRKRRLAELSRMVEHEPSDILAAPRRDRGEP
jgi:hypothetical protein